MVNFLCLHKSQGKQNFIIKEKNKILQEKRLITEAEIKSVDLYVAFREDRRKLNLIPFFVDPSHAEVLGKPNLMGFPYCQVKCIFVSWNSPALQEKN